MSSTNALTIRQSIFSSKNVKISKTLHFLALSLHKKYHKSYKLLKEALGLRQISGSTCSQNNCNANLDISILYHDIAKVLFELKRLEEARDAYSAAFSIRSHVLGEIDPVVADTFVKLGGIHLTLGNFVDATCLLQSGKTCSLLKVGECSTVTASLFSEVA